MEFEVYGTPAPQGSKRAFVVKGRAVLTEDNKRSRPWRDSVAAAAVEAMGDRERIDGPVGVDIDFWFVKPATVKRNHPSVRPDIDKLTRTVLDALTAAGVIRDDAQVCELTARKQYAEKPGATVYLWRMREVSQ